MCEYCNGVMVWRAYLFGVDMQLQGFTIYSFVVVSDSFILFIMTTFWATCSSKVYNLQCSFVVASDSFILFMMTRVALVWVAQYANM